MKSPLNYIRDVTKNTRTTPSNKIEIFVEILVNLYSTKANWMISNAQHELKMPRKKRVIKAGLYRSEKSETILSVEIEN